MIKPKVNIISLGCSKNLVDSEKIITSVAKKGGIVCKEKDNADVIVINTCGFIDSAKEESVDTILETARLKEEGKCKQLIVTGCLAQRYKNELKKEIPEIDNLVGLNNIDKISSAVFQGLNGNKTKGKKDLSNNKDRQNFKPNKKNDNSRDVRLTPKHYAYLKISEGCNNFCTYCSIPSIRGKYKSTPIENIVNEANSLALNGVKELNIIAQDTTAYGIDIYKKQSLHLLLKKISEIKPIKWIRLLYTHPAHIYNELIDEIARNDKICKYIDMPIQHINDDILKKMGRGTTHLQIARIIDKLRNQIPNLILRTSIIVGFPNETKKRFNELVSFVQSTRFERLGVFIYSREEDTPASLYKGQVSNRLKNERFETLMAIQQKITFENNEKMIGKKLKVLIDSHAQSQNVNHESEIIQDEKIRYPVSNIQYPAWLGRYYADAPEVDSNVIVTTKHNIKAGTFKEVIINGVDNYDLVGEIQ